MLLEVDLVGGVVRTCVVVVLVVVRVGCACSARGVVETLLCVGAAPEAIEK